MTDDTKELDEWVEQEALRLGIFPLKRPALHGRSEHEELLDARDVVEAADELFSLWDSGPHGKRWRTRFKPQGFEKLGAELKKYWEKWGEKK